MNWIKQQYLVVTPFYLVFAALWAWARGVWFPELEGDFWDAYLGTLLGAYMWFTLWTVFVIVRQTLRNKKQEKK